MSLFPEALVLAKKTSKNQITLPKKIADGFPGVDYFEVTRDADSIVLRPVRPNRAWEVRERLKEIGVGEDDVTEAVVWARRERKAKRR